ncbi:hypothetical protein BC828DRAFT_418144 [Blastocladiella britannica]|nr:hypothetical protein BC828DRAFT_418144 [Blastocladiella britannica]
MVNDDVAQHVLAFAAIEAADIHAALAILSVLPCLLQTTAAVLSLDLADLSPPLVVTHVRDAAKATALLDLYPRCIVLDSFPLLLATAAARLDLGPLQWCRDHVGHASPILKRRRSHRKRNVVVLDWLYRQNLLDGRPSIRIVRDQCPPSKLPAALAWWLTLDPPMDPYPPHEQRMHERTVEALWAATVASSTAELDRAWTPEYAAQCTAEQVADAVDRALDTRSLDVLAWSPFGFGSSFHYGSIGAKLPVPVLEWFAALLKATDIPTLVPHQGTVTLILQHLFPTCVDRDSLLATLVWWWPIAHDRGWEVLWRTEVAPVAIETGNLALFAWAWPHHLDHRQSSFGFREAMQAAFKDMQVSILDWLWTWQNNAHLIHDENDDLVLLRAWLTGSMTYWTDKTSERLEAFVWWEAHIGLGLADLHALTVNAAPRNAVAFWARNQLAAAAQRSRVAVEPGSAATPTLDLSLLATTEEIVWHQNESLQLLFLLQRQCQRQSCSVAFTASARSTVITLASLPVPITVSHWVCLFWRLSDSEMADLAEDGNRFPSS